MTDRGTSWSVTINNPNANDEECLALARQKGWKVEGQLEKGKEGTLHYQLLVKTPQVRFSALKKAFPRAHIELARNVAALQQYVSKEETRAGELPSTQEKYPSLSKFWDLLYNEMSDILDYPPDDYAWGDVGDKVKLDLFDEASANLIAKGYHVETLAVNPQTRSAFAKFSKVLFMRAYADRQTDRQSVQVAEHNILPSDINNGTTEDTQSTGTPSS